MPSQSSLGGLLFLTIALSFSHCASQQDLTDSRASNPARTPAQVSTGEYLITLKGNADPKILGNLCLKAKLKQARALGNQRFLFRVRPDPGLEAITRAADKSGQVAAIQPNFRYEALPALPLKTSP